MLGNKTQPAGRRLDLAKGDQVVVIAGKDKGKQGEILRTVPAKEKVVVQGVNLVKRHLKAGQRAGGNRAMQGGIIDFESPIHRSNVMLVCPSCGRPTPVKKITLPSGSKAIQCKHCGEPYERVRRAEAQ
ncbi:MAG: 50S ribosomal protein L24 [Candidatus Dormiibacterota bacterium]